MSFDGIFTKAVVDEIYPLLLNGKINKINQPDKNEINLQIYNKENYKLLLSCANNLSRIHLSEKSKKNPITAYNFCMLLRKHLVGGTIKNIYQHKMDRVVCFEIENLNELNLSISGGEKQKIIIARALLRNSNFLVFDEAMSNIDKNSISIIEKMILSDGSLGLINISHNYSEENVKMYDYILEFTGEKINIIKK